MLKDNFKDQIVNGNRTRQIVDAKTGAIIHDSVVIQNTFKVTQAGDVFGSKEVNEERVLLNRLESGIGNLRSITATIAKTQINSTSDVAIKFNTYLTATNCKDVDTSMAEVISSGDIKIKKAGRYMLSGEFNYIMHSLAGVGAVTICYINGKQLCQTVSGARWSNLIGGVFCAPVVLKVNDIVHVGVNTDYDVSDIGRAILDVIYLGGV